MLINILSHQILIIFLHINLISYAKTLQLILTWSDHHSFFLLWIPIMLIFNPFNLMIGWNCSISLQIPSSFFLLPLIIIIMIAKLILFFICIPPYLSQYRLNSLYNNHFFLDFPFLPLPWVAAIGIFANIILGWGNKILCGSLCPYGITSDFWSTLIGTNYYAEANLFLIVLTSHIYLNILSSIYLLVWFLFDTVMTKYTTKGSLTHILIFKTTWWKHLPRLNCISRWSMF